MQVLWEGIFHYTPWPEALPVHDYLSDPSDKVEPANLSLPTLAVLAGGEQAGKTTTAASHVLGRWTVDKLVWLVGNRYEDCKAEYQYVRDAAVLAGAAKEKDCSYAADGPWAMTYTNGHIVKVLSSEDVTKLAREAPNGIVLCEPGRQTFEAFQYAWRRAVPRNAWMLIAGTFEGSTGASRWYPDLWRECQGDNPYGGRSFSLPSYANRSLYPKGASDPKFVDACKAIMASNPMEGEEEIDERFRGIPRTQKGLVFSEFRRTVHVKDYAEFLPGVEVTLSVDPGYFPSAYSVGFWQNAGGQDRRFDEIYVHRMVSSEVLTLVENHASFPNVTHVVMDVAAGAHAGAQDSAYETWLARLGPRGITISGQMIPIEERNNRIHDRLRINPLTNQPYTVIHPRCRMTAFEFEEGYRLRERRVSGLIGSDNPIDKDNHAVAEIGYYIVDRYGYADGPRRALPPARSHTPAFMSGFGRRQQFAGSR